jgi:hypothetical protein
MSKARAREAACRFAFASGGLTFRLPLERLFPMKFRLFAILSLAAVFAGCSTFNQAELMQIQSRGVRPELVTRLQHNRPLTPPEVITLSRRGVPDPWILRYLHANGVDILVTPADMRAMRRAGVSVPVCDAVYAESAIFAGLYTAGPPSRFHYGMAHNDAYIDYPDYYGFQW